MLRQCGLRASRSTVAVAGCDATGQSLCSLERVAWTRTLAVVGPGAVHRRHRDATRGARVSDDREAVRRDRACVHALEIAGHDSNSRRRSAGSQSPAARARLSPSVNLRAAAGVCNWNDAPGPDVDGSCRASVFFCSATKTSHSSQPSSIRMQIQSCGLRKLLNGRDQIKLHETTFLKKTGDGRWKRMLRTKASFSYVAWTYVCVCVLTTKQTRRFCVHTHLRLTVQTSAGLRMD